MTAEKLLEETEIEYTPHFSADSFSKKAFFVDRVASPLPNFYLNLYDWSDIKGVHLVDSNFLIQR